MSSDPRATSIRALSAWIDKGAALTDDLRAAIAELNGACARSDRLSNPPPKKKKAEKQRA